MKWSRALYGVLIFVVLAFLYGIFVLRADTPETVNFSTVAQLARDGQVEAIRVDQDKLTVTLRDGTELTSNKEPEIGVVESLQSYGVDEDQLRNIKITVAPRSAWMVGWLSWAPFYRLF
jgi:ATP-dependent Zn protease